MPLFVKGVTALDEKWNIGRIPLKKLKPEMFIVGPHFENWKRRLNQDSDHQELSSLTSTATSSQVLDQRFWNPYPNNLDRSSSWLPFWDNRQSRLTIFKPGSIQ